jgi:hypothetical protein
MADIKSLLISPQKAAIEHAGSKNKTIKTFCKKILYDFIIPTEPPQNKP